MVQPAELNVHFAKRKNCNWELLDNKMEFGETENITTNRV